MLLYIMLACLMLLAALFNAVCLHNAYFLHLTFANTISFHALSWVIDKVCLFQILPCIMHSAFSQLSFLILCSHHFLYERAMCSREKKHFKITITIIIIILRHNCLFTR